MVGYDSNPDGAGQAFESRTRFCQDWNPNPRASGFCQDWNPNPQANKIGIPTNGSELLFLGRANYQHFDLGLGLVAEVYLDGVERDFFDRPFQANHVGLNVEVLSLEGLGDFRGADRAVEVALFVGVGFDLDRDSRDLLGEHLQVGDLRLA